MSTADLLRPFCSVTDEREWLHAPVRHDGFLYASDGNILVRVPDDPHCFGFPLPANTSFERLIRDATARIDDMRPPTLTLPDPTDCGFCSGSGLVPDLVYSKCRECENGFFWHGTHEYECRECSGEGSISRAHTTKTVACEKCDGDGSDPYQVVEIDGETFARRYLAKIIGLPGVRIHVAPKVDGFGKPASFAWDGGIGVLMPCRGRS